MGEILMFSSINKRQLHPSLFLQQRGRGDLFSLRHKRVFMVEGNEDDLEIPLQLCVN